MTSAPVPRLHGPRADRLNRFAGSAAVAAAAVLIGVKLWAFAATGALSVAASLADSALDLLASLAGFVAVIYAARPPDEDHGFGHASAEDLAALGQAALVSISACAIGATAIERLAEGGAASALAAEGAGLIAMTLSIAVTGALVLFQTWVARRTGSKVIAADRLHYIGDLAPNLGALAALAVSARWGVGGLDAAVALLAAGWLLWNAAQIGAGAWHALMDRAADGATVARIAAICDAAEGLAGWHGIRTRTSGARLFIMVHAQLDAALPLGEAHARAEALREALEAAFPGAEAIVRKDPALSPPSVSG